MLICVAKWHRRTAIPQDDVESIFYFDEDSANDEDCADAVFAFYDEVQDTAVHVGDFMSGALERAANGFEVVVYEQTDLDGSSFTGPPIDTFSYDPRGIAGGSSPLPAEVAVVLSAHGDLTDISETAVNPSPPPATIRPAQRRRTRTYIGPLNNRAGTVDSNGELKVNGGFLDTIMQAGQILSTAAVEWVAWSRLDAALYPIVGGFVDNAFDTQRRRGEEATDRVSDSWI